MQLRKVERKKARIKLALQGPSGSGKTYSALLIAHGICEDWEKIVVLDTENNSADLYAHLGDYNVFGLSAPFTPENYISAIEACANAGMEVIIIDSISHEWEGSGGILDIHSGMTGNSFTNWNKLTPRHNAFVQTILQTKAHIIGTIRTKQDYVLTERNGKQVPEKVGLKGVTREGMDYEFTIVFDLDIKHNATASKDRTSLFMGKPDCQLTPAIGKIILDWCNQGTDITASDISVRIGEARSIQDLLLLYQTYPQFKQVLKPEYELRKREILINQEAKTQLLTIKTSENGEH
ncbi:MAG: AAA family ATPase [Puia sp.]